MTASAGPAFGIYVPAYNAAATLPEVIGRVPEGAWSRCVACVIVDDGSGDDTSAVIDALAAERPAIRRVTFPENRGYGAAVRAGLSALLDTPGEYFVCLHADGQYPPETIEAFVDHAAAEGLDLLQGSRHRDGTARAGGMPLYKRVAGRVLCALENAAFGLRMTDYHSGYLVVSRRTVERVDVQALSGYFDFDLELIAAARSRDLAIGELGIPTHYGDEVSYLNPLVYGLRVLAVIGRYVLGGYR